jgi:hypothetical protein
MEARAATPRDVSAIARYVKTRDVTQCRYERHTHNNTHVHTRTNIHRHARTHPHTHTYTNHHEHAHTVSHNYSHMRKQLHNWDPFTQVLLKAHMHSQDHAWGPGLLLCGRCRNFESRLAKKEKAASRSIAAEAGAGEVDNGALSSSGGLRIDDRDNSVGNGLPSTRARARARACLCAFIMLSMSRCSQILLMRRHVARLIRGSRIL